MASEELPPSLGEARYTRIRKVGEGTYGQVFKAFDRRTSNVVAIKMISLNSEQEGVPSNAVREISLLKKLNHPNIVKLLNVIFSQSRLSLVFEYCDQDLKQFLSQKQGQHDTFLSQTLMYQMLNGIAYCHSELILHRDLKPSNILIDKHGLLKLADFGLARPFGIPVAQFSSEVVTLWYRSPDVLLGAVQYDTSIDMWSAGCIFAEILSGQPLFQGNTSAEQLMYIFECLGIPDKSHWQIDRYPKYQEVYPMCFSREPIANGLEHKLPRASPVAIELLKQLLCLKPDERISATEALKHRYFDPLLEKVKSKKRQRKGKKEKRSDIPESFSDSPSDAATPGSGMSTGCATNSPYDIDHTGTTTTGSTKHPQEQQCYNSPFIRY
eukprot:gene1832-4931_t